jgi:hypothetical protein
MSVYGKVILVPFSALTPRLLSLRARAENESGDTQVLLPEGEGD